MHEELICHAICMADAFRQEGLRKYIREQPPLKHQLCPDYLYMHRKDWGEAVIFINGSVVFWGVHSDDMEDLLKALEPCGIDVYKRREDEVYHIEQGEGPGIVDSTIVLDNDKIDSKIAISYALSQAVKLKHYENIVMETMPDILTLPSDLAANGHISISKKNALRKTGEIFLVRAQINLHSDLLDTPEYFWERSEREESIYKMVTTEMELAKRVKKLNHRLDIMQSTFDLLRAHIEHKDTMLLELTITILIALEIVMTIVQYIWPLHLH